MFTEYQEYGGTLEETTYNQLEFEARAIIDYWTFNRLQNEEIYPEAVKRCVFKLVQLINDKQKAMMIKDTQSNDSGETSIGITSESNDGVSTSYNVLSAKEMLDTAQNEIKEIIYLYLSSVKNSLGHRVLYRGVYPNE